MVTTTGVRTRDLRFTLPPGDGTDAIHSAGDRGRRRRRRLRDHPGGEDAVDLGGICGKFVAKKKLGMLSLR